MGFAEVPVRASDLSFRPRGHRSLSTGLDRTFRTENRRVSRGLSGYKPLKRQNGGKSKSTFAHPCPSCPETSGEGRYPGTRVPSQTSVDPGTLTWGEPEFGHGVGAVRVVWWSGGRSVRHGGRGGPCDMVVGGSVRATWWSGRPETTFLVGRREGFLQDDVLGTRPEHPTLPCPTLTSPPLPSPEIHLCRDAPGTLGTGPLGREWTCGSLTHSPTDLSCSCGGLKWVTTGRPEDGARSRSNPEKGRDTVSGYPSSDPFHVVTVWVPLGPLPRTVPPRADGLA